MSISDKRIYLASRSPRRRDLLKQIGVPFELLLLREDLRRGADVDETPLADESPGAYVLRIAKAKAAMAVRQIAYRGLPQKPVLAADTTVVFDDQIVGKPDDAEHAARILRSLSGREHQVLTAVAVALREKIETQISVSSVWFRELSETDIRRYVRERRAARQGRRLRHPGAGGRVRDADLRQLFRYHGIAAGGNHRAAAEIQHSRVVGLFLWPLPRKS